MIRWLSLTILMTAALAGCGGTGKKSTTSAGPRPTGTTGTTAVAQQDPPGFGGGTRELVSTTIAGRAVNGSDRPLPDATIQIVMVPEEADGKPVGAPVTLAPVHTDRDGYFVIPDLKPDRNYLYVANARDGEVAVATFGNARPPQPRLLLKLSAEMARDMPKMEEMLRLVRQGKQGTSEPPAATLETPQAPPSTAPTTSSERTPGWEAQIETPIPGRDPSGPSPGTARPAGYVTNPSPWPPPARIEPPPPKLQIEKSSPAPLTPPGERTSLGPSPPMPTLTQGPRRPYCDLEANQLKSFAVRDLGGQLYEFRRDQHPKLVLLQFWHTTCPPCLQSIPQLKQWQSTYGGYGLEIIGICYEKGSIADQARRVEAVGGYASVRGFNYPILLGGDSASCPLHTKLQIEGHPAFVLLDQSGRIVYHSKDHGLDPVGLERTIRERLGIR